MRGLILVISALGVVFGDIGTSPLYAMNLIFGVGSTTNEVPNLEMILGSTSLVFWVLTIIISFKYMLFVLRADNDGEGGVLAIYSMLHRYKKGYLGALKFGLMAAVGLLIGEGMITPAMSVLSAAEGLNLVSSEFSSFVLPITLVILFGLFFIQSWGSSKVGILFGPIAFIWFLFLAGTGLYYIFNNPVILWSLNPKYAFELLNSLSVSKILILFAGIMLVITGGEAIFSDLGHFGRSAIRRAWFFMVYPALVFSYLGQGAFLLSGAEIIHNNLFFSMVPQTLLIPSIILALVSTVIASQALITAAFSLIAQAVALGIFPRLKIVQMHQEHEGQIYVPMVNLFLLLGSVSLVLIFKQSGELAKIYGLSMALVMLITSLVMLGISTQLWKWPMLKSILIFGVGLLFEILFVVSKTTYFLNGGFFPLLVGLLMLIVMITWRWGRKSTYKSYTDQPTGKIKDLIEIKKKELIRIDRNMVFMVPKPLTSIEDNLPVLVQFYLNRYQVLPKNIFFVEVIHRKSPYVNGAKTESTIFFKDDTLGSIVSVRIHFGFMEEPNVEKALEELAERHEIELPNDPHKWLIRVSHEYLLRPQSMNPWQAIRFRIFVMLRQVTQPAYYYYGLGRDISLTMDIMPVKISN